MFCAVIILSLSLTFAVKSNISANMKGSDFSTIKSSWQKDMLQLQVTVIPNDRDFQRASKQLRLDELNCSPWYRLELGLFGPGGNQVWPINKNPGHDYDSPVEKRFLQDGKIDLRREYLSAIQGDGKQKFSRFKKSKIEDNKFWTSPHRHRNRLEYYYRSIEVDSELTIDLQLGFCEGCKVFLNGKEVFAKIFDKPRKCAANQAKAELKLCKGKNHLLVKLSSFKLPAAEHNTYFSFNPIPRIHLKEEAIRLFTSYPLQADWFMQDTDRLAEAPVGADLNTNFVPKNMVAYFKPDRTTEFEEQLIKRVLSELSDKQNLQKELDVLVRDNPPISDQRWLDLYVKACQERRLQRLENVKSNSPKILFIKNHMLRPSFYGYTEGLSCANFERNFVPGSSLCLLQWEGGQPKITELLKDEDGRFRDIDVSWDGKRILFAWKKSLHDDDYHLYEMTWPDRNVRQLTFGLNIADFEGRYLPDGNIIFSSSRCISTTDCWTTEVSNLYTCDKDGRFIRRLGYDQVVTCYPSVLQGGSVVYTRWDYNDRGQVFPQPLFQMNPDGTGQTEYYGNNSWFPTVINHARGIPGTGKVLAVLHGHHTWQAGQLAIIDRNKGTQETNGVQIIAPPREPSGETRGFSYQKDADGWITPVTGEQKIAVDRYGQDGNLHRHPYPLSANDMIVAMTPYMNAREEGDKYNIRFHLYWMDIDGRREMLVNDHAVSCANPMPLLPRKRPHVRSSVVDHTKDYGTYFMQDIYEGPGLKGIKRGTVKKLRVVEIQYRALKVGSNNSGGRGGGAMSSTPVSTGNGCWDVKKILGEATVYEDGSAMFKVPANTPVYFQAIDKNGSMVQTMRSWSTLMPNETYGCVGCHEDKRSTPLSPKTTLAMNAGVQELTPFYGPPRGFSFLKEIQPILNKNCISCHDGIKAEEKTEKPLLDLTDKRYEDKASKRLWTLSYINLTNSKHEQQIRGHADHKRLNWVSAQSVPTMLPPYFRGSAKSRLMTNLRKGHGDTQLSQKELDKFAAWIDLGVPFCGDYLEANAWTDDELMHYIQMQRKRERLAAEVRESSEAVIELKTGKPYSLPVAKPRYVDYMKERGISDADIDRGYYNVALNPDGKRGEFPNTSSNSVCRDLTEFSHKNVIDGKTDNKGHGKQYPSWGPDMIDDVWLKIDLGKEFEVDKIVAYIRADFPHDSWWESGILEFSDGSRLPIKLKKSSAAQTIAFPKKKVSWVKFTNLTAAEKRWCGFTEIQIWGR